MNTLLIGYDLNKAGKNYDGLITSIKDSPDWWHYLDSTWLVKTNLTVEAMRNQLSPYIDNDDELLVIDATDADAAWVGFNNDAARWLREKL